MGSTSLPTDQHRNDHSASWQRAELTRVKLIGVRLVFIEHKLRTSMAWCQAFSCVTSLNPLHKPRSRNSRY